MNEDDVREWVEGQFYNDIEEKTPSEDYEHWVPEAIEKEVERMTTSLICFLEDFNVKVGK